MRILLVVLCWVSLSSQTAMAGGIIVVAGGPWNLAADTDAVMDGKVDSAILAPGEVVDVPTQLEEDLEQEHENVE